MRTNEQLQNLRGIYLGEAFDINECEKSPFLQFDKWLNQAIEAKCDEPNAFVLSTVKNNEPNSRVVLLKGITDDEFIFYTNYESTKAQEIQINPKVALTFLWLPLQRQVRIKGEATLIDPKISDEYFLKRPRGSQLGAIASPQSRKVENLKALEQSFIKVEEKYKDFEIIPRPSNWGGYKVKVSSIEFWQGRDNRMHDRILYTLENNHWNLSRLAP